MESGFYGDRLLLLKASFTQSSVSHDEGQYHSQTQLNLLPTKKDGKKDKATAEVPSPNISYLEET